MSWADYYKCDAGHIGLRPAIQFVIGNKVYLACSQECRNKIEKQAHELRKLGDKEQSQ